MENLVDYTVLVHAPREVQIERVSLRSNFTWADATARVDAQPPSKELLAKPVDYVIQNTSDYIALNAMVAGLWKNIQTKKS
jgi:dephospho-CoA kinase